jgi:hypothetical protein
MTTRDIDRREFLRRSVITGAGATLAGGLGSALLSDPAEATGSARHGAPGTRAAGTPVLLGAHALPRGSQPSEQAADLAFERLIGRKLRMIRRYTFWDSKLPDAMVEWGVRTGRTPYVSWHAYTRSRHPIPWAQIAAGDHDAYIRAAGAHLARLRRPVWFSFHHEPENDPSNGSPADFRAAFERVRTLFDAAGAHNLRWVVALMSTTYSGGHGGVRAWLPAHWTFDMVGSDGYNHWPLKKDSHWKSFEEIFLPSHHLAASLGKKLFVAESGTIEQTAGGYPGDPQAKARWFSAIPSVVARWPHLVAMSYSHTQWPMHGTLMPYWVDTSPASLHAFTRMSRNRRL